MNQLFVNSMIPRANSISVFLGNGIHCYEFNSSIYVLVNSISIGSITQHLKDIIDHKLFSFSKPIVYVSMFKCKSDFTSKFEIAWGTYVWFADAPNHYIHFEDKPSKINLLSKI